MAEFKQIAEGGPTSDRDRTRGIVISIDMRSHGRAPAQLPLNAVKSVTQARLAQGLQLRLEEMRITLALREFRLQIEADLAAGAQIESGDLRYDPELRIVRPNVANALVRG